MSVEYKLVNPYIQGKFDSFVKANTPLEAAEIIWNRFAENVCGTVDNFCFTLREARNDSLTSFEVREKKGSGKFFIKEIEHNKGGDAIVEYLANSAAQKGGKRRTYRPSLDSDSSSSSDSDFDSDSDSSDDLIDDSYTYIPPRKYVDIPIVNMHYSTRMYHTPIKTITETKPIITVDMLPVMIPTLRYSDSRIIVWS